MLRFAQGPSGFRVGTLAGLALPVEAGPGPGSARESPLRGPVSPDLPHRRGQDSAGAWVPHAEPGRPSLWLQGHPSSLPARALQYHVWGSARPARASVPGCRPTWAQPSFSEGPGFSGRATPCAWGSSMPPSADRLPRSFPERVALAGAIPAPRGSRAGARARTPPVPRPAGLPGLPQLHCPIREMGMMMTAPHGAVDREPARGLQPGSQGPAGPVYPPAGVGVAWAGQQLWEGSVRVTGPAVAAAVPFHRAVCKEPPPLGCSHSPVGRGGMHTRARLTAEAASQFDLPGQGGVDCQTLSASGGCRPSPPRAPQLTAVAQGLGLWPS